MRTAKTVTFIPPTVSLHTAMPLTGAVSRRVCGYARVSTDNEEQLGSYEAQMEYYGKFIREHEGWEFAGLYSDEGISGTSIRKRKGFQRMVADAMDGKFDLIVTKSISRFARNTVDSISTVRQLKTRGVEVYFEKDGLWTFDPAAELTISILSSIAQEESRNLSQNVTWGQRARFAEGKVSMPYKNFLGYDRGEDGTPVVNEAQAAVVRRIYAMFLDGKTVSGIAAALTAEGVPTPGGRRKWQPRVVENILTNEKYKGDALLQKTYCADFLTKKMKRNGGEVPQYYVEGSHPPIVGAALFDHAREELKRRKAAGNIRSASCFSGRIVCGDCGSIYGSKVWHSNDKYRRTVWQCNGKYKGGEKCGTPTLSERDIKESFLGFMNSLIADRQDVVRGLKESLAAAAGTAALEAERDALQAGCEGLMEQMRQTAGGHDPAQGQAGCRDDRNALSERYNNTRKRLAAAGREIAARNARQSETGALLRLLESRDGLMSGFDEALWLALVRRVKAHAAGSYTFVLMDGTELNWEA